MGEKWNAIKEPHTTETWQVQSYSDGELHVLCRGMTEEDAQRLVGLLNAIWSWEF